MLRNKIYKFFIAAVFVLAFTSCGNDDLDPNSIFDDKEEVLDPDSYSYKFDKWLQVNYLLPYNLDFRYKMQDVGTDMDYNLVPAEYGNAIDLATLTNYLWFDVYSEVVDEDFLKKYGPRIIHLIGSPAYNPANGTMILGLAEGGIKVSLFRVNSIDVTDFNQLNEYYFKTMHHEFAHILHQTKTYPKEFNLISVANYEPFNWQDRADYAVASLGFTSPYASSQNREDFAETIANYITFTDAQWEEWLWIAGKGWVVEDEKGNAYCCYYYKNGKLTPIVYCRPGGTGSMLTGLDLLEKLQKAGETIVWVPDTDGVDGPAVIEQKTSIARNWFETAWGIDLDALRAEVQYRQFNFDIDALRAEVENQK